MIELPEKESEVDCRLGGAAVGGGGGGGRVCIWGSMVGLVTGIGGIRLVLLSARLAPLGESGEFGDATFEPKYETRFEGGDCGERGVSILLGSGGTLLPGTGGGAPRMGSSGPLPLSVISSSDAEPALADCSAGGGGEKRPAALISDYARQPASSRNVLSRLCTTRRSPGMGGGPDRSGTGGSGSTCRSSCYQHQNK